VIDYLQQEIEHRGIYRCEPGTCIPSKEPNSAYTWQFYLRRCMYNPQFLMKAAAELIMRLDLKDKQLGACEDAGVPLACAISMLAEVPMLTIKKSRKAYGLLNFTEGPITGKPVVLVDDLAGSQNTLMKAAALLKEFRVPVDNQYVTLVNKTQGTNPTYLNGKLISLFTCEDFALSWDDYKKKYKKVPDFGFFC